jgi:hypothetical protein
MSCRSNRRHCRGRKPSYRTLNVERLDDRIPFAADTLPTLIDPSGDGVTSPVDLLVVINADQRRTTAQQFPAADLNRDLSIDGVDVSIAKAGVARASRPEGGWGIGRVGTDDLADLITAGGTTTGTTTGTTPGTTRPEITAQIQIRTKYNASAPLIYNDHTQVKPPTATDDAIYQTTIPFEVMIRYSAFDHGGAHLVRIYASWDGEDEELISERLAASYGEEESIAVVVPTRDADEVKVRAELIGNRNDFVGGGTCVIAEGEAAEQTREEKMPRLKEGIKKIQGFAADYVSEKAPLSLAENIVEKFAEKEATILDIMDFESVTRGLAEERYDERREHAISAIQLIIQPYFDKLAKEIKGSPQPWYVMKAGEHDPRATLPSDLDVSIRESIEKYEEEPPLRLSNFIDAEFKDIGAILDDEDAKAVRDWMTTGRTLDQAGIKKALLGTEFLERMRLQLPLIRKDSITGHLYIGIDNFSLGNAKSDLRIGTEVIIQKWQIKGHTIDLNLKIENGIFGNPGMQQPEVILFFNSGF